MVILLHRFVIHSSGFILIHLLLNFIHDEPDHGYPHILNAMFPVDKTRIIKPAGHKLLKFNSKC